MNQKLVLPALEGVREGLDARKASGNEDEQEHEQHRCDVAWGRLAGDPGQDLRHGRHQDISEDDCLEQAPAEQHRERNPRDPGLKVALCHLPAHLEGKGHRLTDELHEELQRQAGEGEDPADNHDEESGQPDPVCPDGQRSVPPSQEDQLDKFDSPGPKRHRIERELGTPDAADPQQDWKEKQDKIRCGKPGGGSAEHKLQEEPLHSGNPGNGCGQEIHEVPPLFGHQVAD